MEKDGRKCKAHPSENVTNFCARSGCFVQLCAACICDHTQLHNRNNTKPKYQLLKDVYHATNDNLSKLKDLLTKEKHRVTAIMDGLGQKKKDVKCFLEEARHEAIQIVNRTFDQIQESFYQHLEQHKQKTGLLNETRMNKIYSELNKQTLDICNLQQELNTHQFPKLIKSIHNQFIPKHKSLLEEISKELTNNEQFQPSINCKANSFEEISSVIKRLITTSVSYPIPQSEQIRTRILSRTPIKDTALHLHSGQNRDRSIKKQSMRFKSPMQIKSPRGIEHARLPMNTLKQNNWPRPEPQLKMFSNTYS